MTFKQCNFRNLIILSFFKYELIFMAKFLWEIGFRNFSPNPSNRFFFAAISKFVRFSALMCCFCSFDVFYRWQEFQRPGGGAVTYKMDTYVRLRPRNPGAFGERKILKMRGLWVRGPIFGSKLGGIRWEIKILYKKLLKVMKICRKTIKFVDKSTVICRKRWFCQ